MLRPVPRAKQRNVSVPQNAQDQKRAEISALPATLAPVFCILMLDRASWDETFICGCVTPSALPVLIVVVTRLSAEWLTALTHGSGF
jgi:hypothetical protein